jgi:hypothetical protein
MTSTLAANPTPRPIPFWVKLVAVLVALPTLAFSLLVAIGMTALIDGVTADHSVHVSAPLLAGQVVRIDTRQAHLVLVPGPDGQVSLDDTTSVRAPTRDLARRALDTNPSHLETSPAGVHVTVAGAPAGFEVSRSSQNVIVHVPAAAKVSVTVTAGGVDVRGLSGDLDMTADTGGFSLYDMTITGNVRVSAGAGGIDVGQGTRMAGGTLDLTARAGGVDVRLPADTSARYDLTAGAGGIDVALPGGVNRSAAGSHKSLSGVIGDGSGGQIRASTSAGGISLQVSGPGR